MAKITFDHAVIYNGVLYPANTPIEEAIAEAETNKKPARKVGAKKNDENAD